MNVGYISQQDSVEPWGYQQ